MPTDPDANVTFYHRSASRESAAGGVTRGSPDEVLLHKVNRHVWVFPSEGFPAARSDRGGEGFVVLRTRRRPNPRPRPRPVKRPGGFVERGGSPEEEASSDQGSAEGEIPTLGTFLNGVPARVSQESIGGVL